ncbi:hypothetical protein [Salidesulfovibrio brasiliensis]|uniref:hypothetical protein n=1 Tax=Salidesulfovibrio brasiliensis TaxID=221711 RepID=UPI0012EED31B|nr:hypothetical protein [Salidesulfovibrio brasiliensis]
MFRFLCVLFWALCLIVLGIQGIIAVTSGTWEWFTLMDVAGVLGVSPVSLAADLPPKWAVRTGYVLYSVKLAEALWWAGAGFCMLWAVLSAFGSRR